MGTPGDEAETTLPPKPVAPQPAWKRALVGAWRLVRKYPDYAIPLAALLVGIALGKWFL